MTLPRLPLAAAFALAWTTSHAIERLPIEHFIREPEVAAMKLSPDGKHVAYLGNLDGRAKLNVLRLDDLKLYRVDPGEAGLMGGARKRVGSVHWVGDRRVIVTTMVWDWVYGVLAMDIDGTQCRPISGGEDETVWLEPGRRNFAREVLHRFENKKHDVLLLDWHEEDELAAHDRPDVLRICTDTGIGGIEVKNPGNVIRWAVDANGVVRLGVLDDGPWGAIYRETAKAAWRNILPVDDAAEELRPCGFDPASNRIFVAALTKENRWALFLLDPTTGQKGEALVAHPEYDILPRKWVPTMDGMAMCAPIFSRTKDALLGVRYVTDAPRVKWFDRQFEVLQSAIDKRLPDTVNVFVDSSRDGARMLWLGFSDRDPGTYYLFDEKQKRLDAIAPRMSWIKPAQMAPMFAIKYEARDGLLVHGFLTVPVGYQPKGLPLVVMPHGGPWVRDCWGFDPEVQLLANRGYAVLQMNYRGSPGYGEELLRTARRQIGRKVQDDIEDATRWAIRAGVADPARIAIYGSSYGGFSALYGLAHSAGLYRCGISFAGVTDWPAIFADRKGDPDSRSAYEYWQREIGDPAGDNDFLRSISPVNFAEQITAPVLLIQGREDEVVPLAQAKLMVQALEKVGRKPQTLYLARQGHGLTKDGTRLQAMTRIVAFLEEHLGSGVK